MADIGQTLRETRMRARIDITEVEARTKIRAKYLRAIENEEWDLLPGPVYIKSFLRTYGDYLGLDSRSLVDEFKRRYEWPSDHEQRPIAVRTRERERRPRGPLVPPWAAIGLVLIGVVVALYFVGKHATSNKTLTPSAPQARSPQRTRSTPTRTAAPLPPPPKTVTLELVPTGQVYVCLVDGHGKQLVPGRIFAPGQTIPTETSNKLLLTLGNNAVHMKVNGKTVPVAPSPNAIGFLLIPSGEKPLPSAQQPRCA